MKGTKAKHLIGNAFVPFNFVHNLVFLFIFPFDKVEKKNPHLSSLSNN
jgi:hypothetical protein